MYIESYFYYYEYEYLYSLSDNWGYVKTKELSNSTGLILFPVVNH